MNLDEAIAVLQSDNADCVLMRVSGSVKIKRLADDAQGKLNWAERDGILDTTIMLATNIAREIEDSK